LAIVSVVQDDNVEQAVQKAIKLIGGIESVVSSGDSIVIKPNLVTHMPSKVGMTTDPLVVQAVIELCKSMNPSSLVIAEGSGAVETHVAFKMCGYMELASKYGVELVDLNDCPTTTTEVPGGKRLQSLEIPNVLLDTDVIINIPKLKLYRRDTWASLAIKNLVGAVPGLGVFTDERISKQSLEVTPELWKPGGKWHLPHYKQYFNPQGEKEKLHKSLAESIIDLATVIKPSLNVIDGMMMCRDPDMTHYDSTPLQLNTVLAGVDYLAVDCVGLQIAGRSPLEIPYLKCAVERGIGESNLDKIQIVGTSLDEIYEAWK
jgi:uncharacterized protein (DUF362 family)